MRFMMIILPANYANATPDFRPKLADIENMRAYNEKLHQAGILLALDGLHPPATGARITTVDGKAKVTDGPFTEAKEVVGGFWIIDVGSREEAIAWASRCPLPPGDTLEVRRVFELSDFSADVQTAVGEMEARCANATPVV
jgi:hypothetical protein